MAGRQQPRRDRAGGVEEVDLYRRGGPGHAVDAGIAFVGDVAARRLHGDVALHAGVQRQDAQGGGGPLRPGEAGLQREGHHGGEHVAAVGGGIDSVLVRLQLREQEIEVHAGLAAFGDDADLAGQRVGSAEAVDLPPDRASPYGEQDLVAGGDVGREVGRLEEGACEVPPRMNRQGMAVCILVVVSLD